MIFQEDKNRVRQEFSDFPSIFFVSAKESIGLIPLMEHLRVEYDEYLEIQKNRVKERRFEFIES